MSPAAKKAAKTGAAKNARPGSAAKKAATAKKAGPTKASAKKPPTTRVTAQKTGAQKSPPQKAASQKAASKQATNRSATTKEPANRSAAKAIRRRPAKVFAGIRKALMRRQVELRVEYENQMAELTDLQRDRVGDIAGDDPADTGTKTFEREQEISLANSVMDRMSQVEHALERIEDGTYGYCERCGNPIPKARLEAFPSVTLCVSCKQHEERR